MLCSYRQRYKLEKSQAFLPGSSHYKHSYTESPYTTRGTINLTRQLFFFSKTASLQLALTHAARGTFICACKSPMVAKHQFAMKTHK